MREATLRTIGTVALHVMATNGPCAAIFRWWKVWLLEVDIISEAFKTLKKSTTVTGVPSAHHNSQKRDNLLKLHGVPTTSNSQELVLNQKGHHPAPTGSCSSKSLPGQLETIQMVKYVKFQHYKQVTQFVFIHVTCLFYYLAQMLKKHCCL